MHARSLRRARLVSVAASVAVVAAMSGYVATSAAAAGPPADLPGVPHYFGPSPNWAQSQFTTTTAAASITAPAGAPGGAELVANVDPVTGGISSIDVVTPGSGYVNGQAVTVTGSTACDATTNVCDNATATANVALTGGIVRADVTAPGGGYHLFDIGVSPNNTDPTLQAELTGFGAVDTLSVVDGGAGYTMPVVVFDLPVDPDGVQAEGIAHLDTEGGKTGTGTVVSVDITNAGSGYSEAPGLTIINGTANDPAALDQTVAGNTPAHAANVASTLKLTRVRVDAAGDGFATPPTLTVTDVKPGWWTDVTSDADYKGAWVAGGGATAAAVVDDGALTSVTVTHAGTGYVDPGIRKFVDELPLFCMPPACDVPTNLGKFLPIGVPVQQAYNGLAADEYDIALAQYRVQFNSDIPPSLTRGYVQLLTPDLEKALVAKDGTYHGEPLFNELVNGTRQPILDTTGGRLSTVTAAGQYGVADSVPGQVLGVTSPQYLGPNLITTKNKPVRIVFHNYLPTGTTGNLFVPVDSTLMGSGATPTSGAMNPTNNGTVDDQVRNPNCTKDPNGDCYRQNRADLHLHGGTTPWISDGTPHQWITPANEATAYPQGVSVSDVPDMNLCKAADDGCQTYYYTNQQSARLLFYHDHSWGITRLNVYVGEAAGYLITDKTEQKLVANGTIPNADHTWPLIIQDKTFVPSDSQMYNTDSAKKVIPYGTAGTVANYGQDPLWDKAKYGGEGSLWFHHVYMPAQNPSDPTGMSAYGRWMYGPWFWPPATNTVYGPIKNPYFDPACNLDDPTTWQYQTDPFCEPELIPGTPNLSTGMEQFNDTATVNGVAFPTTEVDPTSYRFRILNASNDRFFNLQWYVADPNNLGAPTKYFPNGNPSEVALDPLLLTQAQTDPNVFPTPIHATFDAAGNPVNLDGPDWIAIGTEGGFLPKPVKVDGQQATTWITDPTRFDVGNVDLHSLLTAPAERHDVIVDFSKFAGKTLILYNDAPAAFPARVASYDYYTGAPDMTPVGANKILPGYGPNTRTVMQVRVKATGVTKPFNFTNLAAAFTHKANGSGVFESGQHPIIVGQAVYNSAYASKFVKSGNCSSKASGATAKCDGYVRVDNTSSFNFNTLRGQDKVMTMPLEPKAIHDEMNSTAFDEYGRMQATLGVEAQPPAPGLQNVTLYPYVNPGTEMIDGTNLDPAAIAVTDANGNPVAYKDIAFNPISSASDGTQIWRITHNGVDTHPVHFHLFDVQLLNRVTWDNIIIPNDPTEDGWKDTVRVSPLEDTIVALRPVVPNVPFEVPNAIRPLNPADPIGSTALFNNVDPQGNPTNPVTNKLVNFGWEYVYHCHILTHEEMDMMRPVSLALPPKAPINATAGFTNASQNQVVVSFVDNSKTETRFQLQRSATGVDGWANVAGAAARVNRSLAAANTAGQALTLRDNNTGGKTFFYRVAAENTVGYGAEFPQLTVASYSDTVVPAGQPPKAVASVTAAEETLTSVRVSWTNSNNNTNTGYLVGRGTSATGPWTVLTATALPLATTSYVDATAVPGTQYYYAVAAFSGAGPSAWKVSNAITLPVAPPVPTGLRQTANNQVGDNVRHTLAWDLVPFVAVGAPNSVTIQWSASSTFPTPGTNQISPALAADATTYPLVTAQGTWFVRVGATNRVGTTWSTPIQVRNP